MGCSERQGRGGADREPDVESGGRDLEQRAEEHPGSFPAQVQGAKSVY
ncbi:MAG: hypothetical protein U0236_15790 [Nitrospira sp.]